jgi:hypothetical protein
MAVPGCDYTDTETGERCGKTPSQPLAIVITAGTVKPGDVSGDAGTSVYSHYCADHFDGAQQAFGQK